MRLLKDAATLFFAVVLVFGPPLYPHAFAQQAIATDDGRRLFTEKIINGEQAAVGNFPWVVRFEMEGDRICGGTLLADGWAVGAAHCFLKSAGGDLREQIHARLVAGLDSNARVFTIDRVVMPFDYWQHNTPRLGGDIALLKLESAPATEPCGATRIGEERTDIPPCHIDVPTQQETTPYRNKSGLGLLITGFGRVREGGPSPHDLRFAVLPSLKLEACRGVQLYGDLFAENGAFLCAGTTNKPSNADACRGDSGGGMFRLQDGENLGKEDERPLLVGLVSFGGWEQAEGRSDEQRTCLPSQKFRVGVYTDIGRLSDWVATCLNDTQNVICKSW